MDLILPDFGLLFWTALVFILLLFILTKFIWKPILSAVNEREEKITEALELAVKTKAEMQTLQAENQNILKEARAERDAIVKDAKEIATKMVADAKDNAKKEMRFIQEPNFFFRKQYWLPLQGAGGLIPPHVLPFHIIQKCFIHHMVTPWCGIVACKIPIAGIGRTTLMKVLDGLIDHLYGNGHT